MKGYKKKLILTFIIMSYIVSAAGCDFIVKEKPVNVKSDYIAVQTPDSAPESEEEEDTSSSVESENSTDTAHENESSTGNDTSSKSDDKSDSSSSSSKAASSGSTSSKAASSSTTSSKTNQGSAYNTSSKTTSSSAETKVTKISLDVYEVELDVGKTKMPIVTMTPYNASNKGEIWKSSDEKIATVNENGVITAVSEGKCVVTVTAAGNSAVNAKVNVTVKGGNKVESIDLSFTETSITVGQTVMPRVTMLPLDADTLEEEWKSDNESVATVDKYGNITGISTGTCKVTVTSVSNPKVSKEVKVTVKELNSSGHEVTQGTSGETYFDGTLVVNKTYGMDSSYNPGGLTSECAAAFENLRRAAALDGITIYIQSGFRSYEDQERLYDQYVISRGKEAADMFSARAGHSEHQTGLTIDCNDASDSFVGTPEAEWLAEHASEYGFIIRYPKGKEDITGYKYEPWHIRYVGKDLAQELDSSGLTLEEYFGITSEYAD